MLAFGVRFDDRVTGKLELFATHATIVHIDCDAAEISKIKVGGGGRADSELVRGGRGDSGMRCIPQSLVLRVAY